jgi:hypothetical protein
MAEELFQDDTAYYSDRSYLSNSALKLLRESPVKFNLWMNGRWERPDTTAFDLGKAVHASVLEGKDIVVTSTMRRDKRNEAYRLFMDENKDKIILSPSDYSDYVGMTIALRNNEEVQALMLGGRPEVPGTADYRGHKVKGKADWLVDGWEHSYILDLKTTAKSLDEFRKSAKYLLYNQQAALYSHIFQVDTFIFVVVEKSWPYEIGIFKCSFGFMESGVTELNASFDMYEHMFVDGHYQSGYARQFIL